MATYTVSLTLSIEANSEEEAIEGFLEAISYNQFDIHSIDVELEEEG